ncbi:ABC transporter permease subunit [Marinomonas rhizomae]|uniref:Amino acid ABC transporter membrane protein 1 (PAAT family) n=1 Tax=Marinomonas rhizomae TaxID=491948 RepID=A0A366JAI8_9GAMM|nr:ABC transporter permease subunit [Marinomonas rhizomae]RBP83972.1 amino acid ABC transporter membrane protein 1 (PAAT family) [Marinomonas rhizomae]RNF73330.1 ABC transporter permease subunit [Marinomonas rhizomae]
MIQSSTSKPYKNPSKGAGLPSSTTQKWTSLLNNDSSRAVILQAIVLALVLFGLWFLFANANENLNRLGMTFGFDFLQVTAGFNISWSLIPYDPGMSYWRVFLVGIVNTLILSFCVIVVGTIIGTVVGILRLSDNPLVSQLARWYVEIVRNVPLLIQIIFWFTVVFSTLPAPRQSYHLGEWLFLNNRGLYVMTMESALSWGWIVALGIALVASLYALFRWSKPYYTLSGSRSSGFYIGLAVWALAAGWAVWSFSTSTSLSVPTLKGFNYSGGAFLPASFGAAFVAMTVYRSAAIAETVRAGMQSIDRGQHEAAFTIGFSRVQSLRLILIPQAIRSIIPPMTNSWLAATKDSSLAVAIGFPELVSVFMQTSMNQTGRAIEIIFMVMGFYIFISLLISYLLNKYNDSVQYKVR